MGTQTLRALGCVAAPATAAWLFSNPIGAIGGGIYGACICVIAEIGNSDSSRQPNAVQELSAGCQIIGFVAACAIASFVVSFFGVNLTLIGAIVLTLQSLGVAFIAAVALQCLGCCTGANRAINN